MKKVPNEAISTMLANYSFSGKIPEELGDPGIPTVVVIPKGYPHMWGIKRYP